MQFPHLLCRVQDVKDYAPKSRYSPSLILDMLWISKGERRGFSFWWKQRICFCSVLFCSVHYLQSKFWWGPVITVLSMEKIFQLISINREVEFMSQSGNKADYDYYTAMIDSTLFMLYGLNLERPCTLAMMD